MERNPKQKPDDFKGPRPEEEISYDGAVCSPEFLEGCKEPTDPPVRSVPAKEEKEQ